MLRIVVALAAWAALAAALPTPAASAADGYVAGEVAVVGDDGTVSAEPVRGDERRAATRIARRPGVRTAVPNARARIAYVPNDPGRPGDPPGGWQALQWNFLATPQGVNAPGAWQAMRERGRPGGEGVVVAVIDTGVAYRDYKRFKASPDLSPRLRRGYDFIAGNLYPVDRNGHGTHVASTIAESVDNGVGVTGLAYGATIMPLRTLNAVGEGSAVGIASAIRFAARRGADVINLSVTIDAPSVAFSRPVIDPALRYARRRGVLVVAAAGNERAGRVAYPASAPGVVAVGATTERGCQASYSNGGPDLDVVAPGGGPDSAIAGDPSCRPRQRAGRNIFQMTLDVQRGTRFGLPEDYEGTSMAAPHVSAIAALVIASGALGPDPAPKAVERRLEATALDLGPAGFDARYGWGKVDAYNAIVAPTSS